MSTPNVNGPLYALCAADENGEPEIVFFELRRDEELGTMLGMAVYTSPDGEVQREHLRSWARREHNHSPGLPRGAPPRRAAGYAHQRLPRRLKDRRFRAQRDAQGCSGPADPQPQDPRQRACLSARGGERLDMSKVWMALPPRRNSVPVTVAINERAFSVPWGREVEMPSEVVEILKRGRYPVLVGEALEAALED